MNKNVRRNVVQFRLSDAEKAAFDEVKQAINAKNNADAIRTMIADERLVNITAQQVSKNNHSMAQLLEQTWSDLGRSSLSRAVLGLQSDEGLNALKQVQDTYDNIQAQLEGLLWSATNLTNNVNQIAHAANLEMLTHGIGLLKQFKVFCRLLVSYKMQSITSKMRLRKLVPSGNPRI